jgi:hypothetical protein
MHATNQPFHIEKRWYTKRISSFTGQTVGPACCLMGAE